MPRYPHSLDVSFLFFSTNQSPIPFFRMRHQTPPSQDHCLSVMHSACRICLAGSQRTCCRYFFSFPPSDFPSRVPLEGSPSFSARPARLRLDRPPSARVVGVRQGFFFSSSPGEKRWFIAEVSPVLLHSVPFITSSGAYTLFCRASYLPDPPDKTNSLFDRTALFDRVPRDLS